jgi:hypothetical protein
MNRLANQQARARFGYLNATQKVDMNQHSTLSFLYLQKPQKVRSDINALFDDHPMQEREASSDEKKRCKAKRRATKRCDVMGSRMRKSQERRGDAMPREAIRTRKSERMAYEMR